MELLEIFHNMKVQGKNIRSWSKLRKENNNSLGHMKGPRSLQRKLYKDKASTTPDTFVTKK